VFSIPPHLQQRKIIQIIFDDITLGVSVEHTACWKNPFDALGVDTFPPAVPDVFV